ncbi:LysR substrate-binding domain-containing protein [Paenibacillus sp. MZ04-78.2]|uniref:LysR substrate-binding domain-containing protein n=1 Tax=Paenibacillus sp. MZ04-78.2 TaxID=2962034 RepID=UPI002815150F|nr:LysR substrate-binding domain-containing protein [Paenibacillus sp. MZ04-78.2]
MASDNNVKLVPNVVRAVRETEYPSGPLAIGVVETVNCRNLMNVLADFQARYPGVSLSITTGETYPDLAHTKWAVSPKGCPFRAVLEAWLRSEGIPLANMLEVSSLKTLLSCVRSGLAATLLPQSVLSGEFELGSYPVPEAFRYTTTSFVRRNDGFSSKACAAFVEMVKVSGL